MPAWLGAWALIAGLTLRAAPGELGHAILRSYPPGRSGFNRLVQAGIQDDAGFIYIGDWVPLHFYDGTKWSKIEGLPPESTGVQKFVRAGDGTLFAAGSRLIGFFRGAGPDAKFISLAPFLPPTRTGVDDLTDILAAGDAVYFSDEEKILIWRAEHFTVVPYPAPLHSHGSRLHAVGDTVYVTALDHPLGRIAGNRVETVVDDPVFRTSQIVTIEAGPAPGTLGVLTEERGFFQVRDGHVAVLRVAANRWLAGKKIFRALRLSDGSLAVAFSSVSGDKGMFFDPAGDYAGPIDPTIGLYLNEVRSLFTDHDGGLWLGTEAGVFRLQWPSDITVFDLVNGLGSGAVADVVRQDGVLYAGTSEGVFRLVPLDAKTGRGAHFERIFEHPVYDLVPHAGGLLALGYAEVLQLSDAGFVPVAPAPPGGGALRRSRRDPDRIWIVTAQGAESIRPTATGWQPDETPGAKVSAADALADAVEADLIPKNVHRLPPLVHEAAGMIKREYEEKTGAEDILWICGAKGLVRLDLAHPRPPLPPPVTRLQASGVHEGDRLHESPGAIAFSFVALRHDSANPVTYQTRLDGLDDDWSAWSGTSELTFRRLPAGSYRFEVRARDGTGQIGETAALSFAVLAPWWRTGWAWGGYGLLGALAVVFVVRLRTRALRHRTEQLEIVVAERTRELQRQAAELGRKNAELAALHQLELDEKIAARLAEEKARLEVLRYQLNPHFLFNALATISGLAVRQPAAARAVTRQLAEFCRLTLTRGRHEFVTLEEEFQLLANYLEVTRAGAEEPPEVSFNLDPGVSTAKIPAFLLLPLVENASKYGRRPVDGPVRIAVSARRGSAVGTLDIEVANTGTWVDDFTDHGDIPSTRIGLENIRQRLARLFPHAHEFAIEARDGWVRARLRIMTGSAWLAAEKSAVAPTP